MKTIQVLISKDEEKAINVIMDFLDCGQDHAINVAIERMLKEIAPYSWREILRAK